MEHATYVSCDDLLRRRRSQADGIRSTALASFTKASHDTAMSLALISSSSDGPEGPVP